MWAERGAAAIAGALLLGAGACRSGGIDPETWDACLFLSRAEAESVLGLAVGGGERGLDGPYATCTYRANNDPARAVTLHWFVRSRASSHEQDAVRYFYVLEDRFARAGSLIAVPDFADRAFWVPNPEATSYNRGDLWVLRNDRFFYITAGEPNGRAEWLMGKELARNVLRRLQ
jgi:hypothetical protein